MIDFVLVKGTLIVSEGHILAILRHEQAFAWKRSVTGKVFANAVQSKSIIEATARN